MSPSTDEDEGPLAALPDQDPFAAAAPQEPGKKSKSKRQKKRKAEAPATTEDIGAAGVSMPAHFVSLHCRQYYITGLGCAANRKALL